MKDEKKRKRREKWEKEEKQFVMPENLVCLKC
jgi:hypothetical protein